MCGRRVSDEGKGKWTTCQLPGQTPSGVPTYDREWPIDALSEQFVHESWGGGTYRVYWIAQGKDSDSGRSVREGKGSCKPFVLGGEPKPTTPAPPAPPPAPAPPPPVAAATPAPPAVPPAPTTDAQPGNPWAAFREMHGVVAGDFERREQQLINMHAEQRERDRTFYQAMLETVGARHAASNASDPATAITLARIADRLDRLEDDLAPDPNDPSTALANVGAAGLMPPGGNWMDLLMMLGKAAQDPNIQQLLQQTLGPLFRRLAANPGAVRTAVTAAAEAAADVAAGG